MTTRVIDALKAADIDALKATFHGAGDAPAIEYISASLHGLPSWEWSEVAESYGVNGYCSQTTNNCLIGKILARMTGVPQFDFETWTRADYAMLYGAAN